jgi:hypothetical protein
LEFIIEEIEEKRDQAKICRPYNGKKRTDMVANFTGKFPSEMKIELNAALVMTKDSRRLNELGLLQKKNTSDYVLRKIRQQAIALQDNDIR